MYLSYQVPISTATEASFIPKGHLFPPPPTPRCWAGALGHVPLRLKIRPRLWVSALIRGTSTSNFPDTATLLTIALNRKGEDGSVTLKVFSSYTIPRVYGISPLVASLTHPLGYMASHLSVPSLWEAGRSGAGRAWQCLVLLALPWELGLPAPRTLTSTIRAGRLDAGGSPAGGWAPGGPHSEAGRGMATRDCSRSPVTAGQRPEARGQTLPS